MRRACWCVLPLGLLAVLVSSPLRLLAQSLPGCSESVAPPFPVSITAYGDGYSGTSGLTSCIYTVTVPQGTPALAIVSGGTWVGPGPAYTPVQYMVWGQAITTASGTVLFSNSGTLASNAMSGHPEWNSNPDLPLGGVYCTGTVGPCDYAGGSGIVVVSTQALTASGDATLTMYAAAAVTSPGTTNMSAWVGIYLVNSMAVLDPVPALQDGNNILADPETLATLGTSVTAAAADSATRVVLRIPAISAGEQLTLTLLDDQNVPNPPAQDDGTFAMIAGAGQPSPMQLTAVQTSEGPMAFAIYYPPADFSRAGRDDSAVSRNVSFAVQALDNPNFQLTTSLRILRPPVVLVHGLWGSQSDWSNFLPLTNDSRFFVRYGNYDYLLGGLITGSTPGYSWPASISKAHTNSLGFTYNARLVLAQIQIALADFRSSQNAAATQVDVVAHSMGGTVLRTAENLPIFIDTNSFGVGYLHKLITIGTPHLGSPLATQLVSGSNPCTAAALAAAGHFAFSSVTMTGSGNVNGGVGDLQGDGFGGALSSSLDQLQVANGHEVPTAMVVGTMTSANTASLGCTFCIANYLRHSCPGEYLTAILTPQGWPTVFGQDSDAVVPAASQDANLSGLSQSGVIHSSGMEDLDFSGPVELDQSSDISTLAVQLLNAYRVASSGFYALP